MSWKLISVVSTVLSLILLSYVLLTETEVFRLVTKIYQTDQKISITEKSNMNINLTDPTHNDHKTQTDIYDTLFPTKKLKQTFDFNQKVFPLNKINQQIDIESFYERSLSLYPGNNGPIVDLIFNKLILQGKCLTIVVIGTSVTCGMCNLWPKDLSKIDKDKIYSNYLKIWMNEMFPCQLPDENGHLFHAEHTVINICHSATSVKTFMKKHFYNDFENNIKYDLIIMERASGSAVNINEIPETLKYWDLYFRSFLKLTNYPVLINLVTIMDLHKNQQISGQFPQMVLLDYYQIPSISYWDSYDILINQHDTLVSEYNQTNNFSLINNLILNNHYLNK
eukprot:328800_1